jgi:hypothetical protein
MASKFFEHFVAIADAMNTLGRQRAVGREDGFYYDHHVCGRSLRSAANPLDGRHSIPLFTVDVLYERDDTSRSLRLPQTHGVVPGASTRHDRSMTYMEKSSPDTPHEGLRLLAIPTRTSSSSAS